MSEIEIIGIQDVVTLPFRNPQMNRRTTALDICIDLGIPSSGDEFTRLGNEPYSALYPSLHSPLVRLNTEALPTGETINLVALGLKFTEHCESGLLLPIYMWNNPLDESVRFFITCFAMSKPRLQPARRDLSRVRLFDRNTPNEYKERLETAKGVLFSLRNTICVEPQNHVVYKFPGSRLLNTSSDYLYQDFR